MSSVGIICEYNPFHNGHLYQIQKIKEKYPDYAIVVVMSGNFTERGEVSIMDKWKRCEIILKHGVDLVVELPYPFATQSADYFSYGSITLLEKLGVRKVVFGSESDNLEDLFVIAKCQLENDEFDKLVKIYSKMGNNYPTAISHAIYDLVGKNVNTPNDLLGVSYIKTILKNNYSIIPETIKRTNDYHGKELEKSISSATAIREALKKKKSIIEQVPEDSLRYFHNLHFMDDYFDILKYKIMTEKDLSIYHTVDEGIDSLLKKKIISSKNYDEFIQSIKTKRYTENKLKRMLLHILCNFTKEKAKSFQEISYIRILGMNDIGREYLNQVKKNIDCPIISKICKEKDEMLEFELDTTKIYDIKDNVLFKREYGKIIYNRKEDVYND